MFGTFLNYLVAVHAVNIDRFGNILHYYQLITLSYSHFNSNFPGYLTSLLFIMYLP